MGYKSLKEYIEVLRSKNELIEIHEFVDPNLEITEICDRFSKQNKTKNKALLFTNNGTRFPLLINGLGSESRICEALCCKTLEEPKERIEEMFAQLISPKQAIWDKIKMLPLLKEMSSWMPKHKKGKGACQEVIETNIDLSTLPILQCWPHDGGKFITFPMVITQHPITKSRNVGMYRMQVVSKDSTAMHWHKHKTGANHYNEYKKLGQKMPIAVALGGDPAHTFSATAPLPENVDEFMLSGFLRKKHVELVKCITNELEVPSDADIIIEGYVDTAEDLFLEGPFGDHTGFYSLPDMYPIFHITCITHKKNAIYPTTIVGIPPMEDAWIGKATERIFLAPIKLLLVPELIDYWMPFEGVAHNLVIAKIKKSFPGQAQKVINTLWGAGQMMFNKMIIVVSEESSFNTIENLKNCIFSNYNPSTDTIILKGPLDVLDHAAPHTGFGSKIGIDATVKLPEENTNHQKSNVVVVSKTKFDENTDFDYTQPSIIVIHDDTIESNDYSTIIWHVLNNINPEKDCNIISNSLLIDGTTKTLENTTRDWPTPVVSSLETIKKIDTIWNSLNIGELLDSPSITYNKLVQKNSAWLYSHNKKN